MARDNWKNNGFEDSGDSMRRTSRPSLLDGIQYQSAEPVKAQNIINSNVVISSPNSFKDVQALIDNLKRREPVIFNLEGISKDSAQRILDFMSGAAYALGGSMKRIKEYLFLVTPEGVSITVPAE
ncbi:MAG: cell division protein SepF [Clostridia bacterium]|nr:cell division protein SepF [Clostridia bacterium]